MGKMGTGENIGEERGREGKDRVPPSVAVKGVPFACEREMGGLGKE